MSKCRGCGADIVWAFSEHGKKVPLDAKPEKRYIVPNVLTDELHIENVGVKMVNTYISHFATCPKADSFRKGK